VYGDPTFTAMVELERRIVELGRARGVLGALARHPAGVLQVVLAVWRLPLVEVTISPWHAARWFSPDFPLCGGPIFGGHLAQAVLDLAPDEEAYLAGRRKQALRTNLRHARRLGVRARSIASYDEWAIAARDIIRSGPDGEVLITQMQPPPATQDMDLLHTFMRSTLRCWGARHLIGGRTGGSAGLQYFQYLLGYEVRNLRITVQDAAADPRSGARSGCALPSSAPCS
jgi:hypothetical protein